jgi:glycosyltransferase involved in cell wall biosynthesis
MPEVSVIIPTYNSARFLGDAIDSVLAQTYEDFEILVIDDGSTDDTRMATRRYGSAIRYSFQANQGVSAARNRGISEASGGWIAFLDSDDIWAASKLTRQMEALRARPACGVCHTAFVRLEADGTTAALPRSTAGTPVLPELLLVGNVVGTPSTVVCRRSLLLRAGGFDPALSQCADWDMWVRLATMTELLFLDEPLVTYKQHASNMSRNPELLERDSLRVLSKGFGLPGLPTSLSRLRRRAFGRNYMVLAGTYLHARHILSFLRCAIRAVLLDPTQLLHLLVFPSRRTQRNRQDPSGGT